MKFSGSRKAKPGWYGLKTAKLVQKQQLPICSTFYSIFVQPCFQSKRVFMKRLTFFISSTICIFTKLLDVSESSIKIKVRSHGALSVIWFTSTVICKKTLLHRNEIVYYLQNCKYYSVVQDHLRKPLQTSARFIKRSPFEILKKFTF